MVVRTFLKITGGFLIALLVLGLILGVTGYFMLRNFDANKFRPELERILSRQTGYRVELGTIRLQWKPAPQLQVSGVKILQPQSLDKILQSALVQIDIDLTSVWRKRLSASRVLLQSPEIFLKRDRRGIWNWQLIDTPQVSPVSGAPMLSKWSLIPIAEAAEVSGPVSGMNLSGVTQGWEFRLGKVLIRDASVHFIDGTVEPAFALDVTHLETEVRQKGSALFFHFIASGNIFSSATKNLETEGDLDLVSKTLDLVLRYGPDKVMFKGLLKIIGTMPHFEGALEIRDLDMEPLIPAAYKQREYVSGRLSNKAQLSLDGANPLIIKRSLKGGGSTGIKDGALKNRNVVKEVFDQLSSVLAITSAMGAELPPELNAMLKGRDTPFQSLQAAYTVESGSMRVTEFRLIHQSYQLSGNGNYGLLDQRVDASIELLLSQSISAFMIKKIRELGLIADRNGQIMIPFRYAGVLPKASIQPDLSYITSRVLQGGADQLLNQGIGRLSEMLGGKKAVQSSTSTTPVSGTTQTTQAVSKKKKKQLWIDQGLNILNQLQEPAQQ